MDASHRIKDLKEALQLSDHPEGGYYREIYRSAEELDASAVPNRFDAARNYATSIYFLLPGDTFSAFHRIKSDEIWYHHEGGSLLIPSISPDGMLSIHRLGKDIEKGDLPQVIIPAGYWFGAKPEEKDSYVLAGCNVTPGFDFNDFEMAQQKQLLEEFPMHAAWIKAMTRI